MRRSFTERAGVIFRGEERFKCHVKISYGFSDILNFYLSDEHDYKPPWNSAQRYRHHSFLKDSLKQQHMGESESRRFQKFKRRAAEGDKHNEAYFGRHLSLRALLLHDIQFLTGPEGGCVVFDSSDFGSNFVVFFIHSDFF